MCSWTAGRPGPRCRSSSAVTCTVPSPRPRRRPRRRPGSTTSAWSPPPTTSKPAPARRSTSPGCPCSPAETTRRRTAMASRAPWAAHFGLARTPFGKAIAAKDLFARQAHAQATARISFCIDQVLLGVITGDVGAGKTVAVRAAVAGLDPTRHQVIYVANPAFGTRGLYVQVVRALGAQPRYLKAELMAQAADLLAAETAERHRTVVLIVDEAHLLQPDQLEELRLMTNAEMDSASPFAGILIGQPTLARQLRMGTFAALDQRIAPRSAIKPMDLAESAAYLKHHLALAGRDEPLFADDAIARLHRVASGLPRALNNAATAALIAAAAAGQDLVDDACAKKAVAELTRD